jgi:hypothetical protein
MSMHEWSNNTYNNILLESQPLIHHCITEHSDENTMDWMAVIVTELAYNVGPILLFFVKFYILIGKFFIILIGKF